MAVLKANMTCQIHQLAASVLVLSAMSAAATVRYVDVNSPSPARPFTNWTTAAPTIQYAIDAAAAGDQIMVTNGVYQAGGQVVLGVMSRVAVNKAVTIQSVNGAAVTLIQGDGATRCVYLTNDTALVGFTLTNGVADYGGGVRCESVRAVLSNCVLTGNSATNSGGGASGGTLNNCAFIRNWASGGGGGAADSTLNNCAFTRNWASGDGVAR
jgi:hypothetical protein